MSLPLQNFDLDNSKEEIIYFTDQPYSVDWTVPAVKELIKLYDESFDLLMVGQIKTKREIFERIAPKLARKGYFYSPAQCENKWKSLKRSYLNKFEKGIVGRVHNTSRLFDNEVEEILKKERPSLSQEFEELFTVNLDLPSEFRPAENGSSNDNEDADNLKTDDELMQRVLNGSDGGVRDSCENNIEYIFSPEDEHDHSYSNKNKLTNKVNKKPEGLEETIKSCLDTNTELLKSNNSINEKILLYLSSQQKLQEEHLEIKRLKLDKQNEILQQLKIQNGLLAKVVQKIGH